MKFWQDALFTAVSSPWDWVKTWGLGPRGVGVGVGVGWGTRTHLIWSVCLDQSQALLGELHGATALYSDGYIQHLSFHEQAREFWASLASTCCRFLPQILSFIFHWLNRFGEILLQQQVVFFFQEGVSFNGLIQAKLKLFQKLDRKSFCLSHIIICLSISLL